jgi:hypothetical protein
MALLMRSMDTLDLSLRVAGPVLLATAAGGCMLLVPVPAVLQTLAGGALYVAVLFLLRSVPPELLHVLPSRRTA